MTTSDKPRPLPSISDLLCKKDPAGDESTKSKFFSTNSFLASTPEPGGISSSWLTEMSLKGFATQENSSSSLDSRSSNPHFFSPSKDIASNVNTRALTSAPACKDGLAAYFAQDIPSRRPRATSQLDAHKTYSSQGFSCVPRTNPATSESDTSSSRRKPSAPAVKHDRSKKVLEALLHIVSDVLSEEADEQTAGLHLGNEYEAHHVPESSPACTCHQHSCFGSQPMSAVSYPPSRLSQQAHRMRPSFAQRLSSNGLGYRVSPSFRNSPYARSDAHQQHQQQRFGHFGTPSPRSSQEQNYLQQSRLLHYIQSMNLPSRPGSRPSPRNSSHSYHWPSQTSASSASSPTARPIPIPSSSSRKAARRPRSSMKVSSPKSQRISRNQDRVGEASASGCNSATRIFGSVEEYAPA